MNSKYSPNYEESTKKQMMKEEKQSKPHIISKVEKQRKSRKQQTFYLN